MASRRSSPWKRARASGDLKPISRWYEQRSQPISYHARRHLGPQQYSSHLLPLQVKLQFKQKNYKEMMVAYKEMLTYIK